MNVLIVGAGGIGSALINTIDFTLVSRLGIVDMDLVEVSNLNRQFLFSASHIGRPKVEAVKDWIAVNLSNFPISFQFYHEKIQNLPAEILTSYNIFFNAVDNLEARLYLNNKLYELRHAKKVSEFVLLDCGSEKLMGHVQIISSNDSPCLACVASLFEQSSDFNVNYCTIKKIPLSFDDCLKVAILQSADTNNQRQEIFQNNEEFQFDINRNPDLNRSAMIHKLAKLKANEFGIEVKQISYTENFLRKFSLNLASTNSMIGALAWSAVHNMYRNIPSNKNYVVINCEHGINVEAHTLEKNPQCRICQVPSEIEVKVDSQMTLSDLERLMSEQRPNDFTIFTEEGHLVLRSKRTTKSKNSLENKLIELLKADSEGRMTRKLECYFKGNPEPMIVLLMFRQ